MNPYAVNMMLDTSAAIHISLLYVSMVAHMQAPFLSFIVLWSIHVGYCRPYLHLALGSSLGPDIMTLWWLGPWDGTNLDFSFARLGLTLSPSYY